LKVRLLPPSKSLASFFYEDERPLNGGALFYGISYTAGLKKIYDLAELCYNFSQYVTVPVGESLAQMKRGNITPAKL
jgi:hypothetical protein